MMALYCWNAAQQAGSWFDPQTLLAQADKLLALGCVLWIDLDRPTPDEERLIYEEVVPVHPLVLEDITRLRRLPDSPPHLPKVEEFPEYLFVIINPLSEHLLAAARKEPPKAVKGGGPCVATQLSAVVTHNVLVTHHYKPVAGVEQLRAFLTRHDAQASRGPDYLFHLILDATVDQYAPVLDHFDEALDHIELRVFRRPAQELLVTLLRLKREIIALRKTLIHEREVLARLSRGEFALIAADEIVYYRNVYDHLVRSTELIESSREMVTDLMQTHLAAASNKLNEVMKVLTMISTTILPMTLIAGIYGMNFENLPEFKWPLGYLWALGLMALSGVASFIFFKWKKWI
jgi:magnesium transporter